MRRQVKMRNKIILTILILSVIALIFSGCVGGSVTPPISDNTDDSEIPEPEVCNLPTYLINVKMDTSSESYFNIELKNVGSGYDIYDGIWNGWCADKGTYIETNEWYQGYIYCSYNPSNLYNIDWPKINWIINNRGSYGAEYVQEAIWHFTNGHIPNGLAMAAEAHPNFCPQVGQKYVAIIDVPGKQLTFMEVPLIDDQEIEFEPFNCCTTYPPNCYGCWEGTSEFGGFNWIDYAGTPKVTLKPKVGSLPKNIKIILEGASIEKYSFSVRKTSKILWSEIMKDKKLTRAGVRKGLIACCLYYACINHDSPRTPIEICNDFGMSDTKQFNKGDKEFIHTFENKARWSHLLTKTLKSDDYLTRYCNKLKNEGVIYENVSFTILKKCKIVNDKLDNKISCYFPKSIAAGIIYYVYKQEGFSITMNKIANSLGVCPPTLSKVVKSIKQIIN